MQVKVRSERADEAAAIRAINDAAFGGPVEGAIVDAIRGTNRWIDGGSLVAEATGGRAVGHLLLSEGDLTDEDHDVRRIWMLGPVAVLPDWQRLGVGAALMHAAIGLARRRDQPLICLLGHADYYPRFGFESARGLGIEPPNPAWSDRHWLALRLPAWSNEVRGRAAFPPAFSTK